MVAFLFIASLVVHFFLYRYIVGSVKEFNNDQLSINKTQIDINNEVKWSIDEVKKMIRLQHDRIQGIEERVEYHIASFSEKSNHNFEMIDTYQKNLIKELNLIQWEKQDLDSVEKLIEAVNARRGCEKLIVKEKRG